MTGRPLLRRPEELARLIDSTLLKAEATGSDIERLCEEAVRFGFHAVCIAPCYIELAARRLKGSSVRVVSVVGFPLGNSSVSVKILEAMEAIKQGAHELDMVINIGALRSGDAEYVHNEIMNVASVCQKTVLKVILETGALTRSQIILGARLALKSGVRWVKTCTGFSYRGATVDDVCLLKKAVGERGFVKASGGIQSLATARKMVRAGASRIGTSHGRGLMEEYGKRRA